jgi:hypothetical protein
MCNAKPPCTAAERGLVAPTAEVRASSPCISMSELAPISAVQCMRQRRAFPPPGGSPRETYDAMLLTAVVQWPGRSGVSLLGNSDKEHSRNSRTLRQIVDFSLFRYSVKAHFLGLAAFIFGAVCRVVPLIFHGRPFAHCDVCSGHIHDTAPGRIKSSDR